MGRAEQRPAVVVDLREDDDRGLGDDQLRQQLAPPAPWLRDQRLAIELEQVEDHVRDRALAPLEQLEARYAVGVERAQLAVEDAVGVRQGRRQRGGDVGVRRVQPLAVARQQLHVVAAHARDRAEAVPLDLVGPAVTGGYALRRPGEHRRVGWLVAWHRWNALYPMSRMRMLGSPRAQAPAASAARRLPGEAQRRGDRHCPAGRMAGDGRDMVRLGRRPRARQHGREPPPATSTCAPIRASR